MAIKKIKVSDLPNAQTFEGLYTLGLKVTDSVDEFGKPIEVKESMKVGLEFVKTAANNADAKATKANDAAIFAGEKATLADEKATKAGKAADRAIETAAHPTYVGNDQYVYKWDSVSKEYVKTDIYVKGDSGVHTGNSPTDYDDVWIDPEGDAATAQYILADNGKSVQENLDDIEGDLFQLLTNKADTTYVNESIQSAIIDSWEGSY